MVGLFLGFRARRGMWGASLYGCIPSPPPTAHLYVYMPCMLYIIFTVDKGPYRLMVRVRRASAQTLCLVDGPCARA